MKLTAFLLLGSLTLNAQFKKIDDTALHVDGSLLMTCTISQIHYNLTDHKSRSKSVLVGVLGSLAIGIGVKEYLHDKVLNLGVYSNKDIVSDVFGTACGAAVITCKFDFDEKGPVKFTRPKKVNNKRYILD